MKLEQLGLKTKPATKYFDHGYIKFTSRNGELYHQVFIYDNNKNPFPFNQMKIVQDKSVLDLLFAIKTRAELVT